MNTPKEDLQPPNPDSERAGGKPPLVLLVEDDLDLRETTALLLEDEGYQVCAVQNGREALNQLLDGPLPGVILLDMLMPVMNGWEFRAQQQRDPRLAAIPVVVVTASRDHLPSSLFPDGSAVLRKPFDLDDLLANVQRYCSPPPASS
jgi:CheY-like chemotaxis protein